MLDKNLPTQSVLDGALRQAISDVLHDPEFVRSLAESLVDALDVRVLQERQIKLEEVKKIFHQGVSSGKGNAAEQVFKRLEEKYSAMVIGSGV
ncbi:MAG: hypothetical protein ABL857_01515 [Rickettsiales bacterium]|jgi:hypothetical protein